MNSYIFSINNISRSIFRFLRRLFQGNNTSIEDLVQKIKKNGGRVYRFGKSSIINGIAFSMEDILSKELSDLRVNGELLVLSFKESDSHGEYNPQTKKLTLFFDNQPTNENFLSELSDKYQTLVHEVTHLIQKSSGRLPDIPNRKSVFDYLNWGWETDAKAVQGISKYSNELKKIRLKVDRFQKNNNISNEDKKEILRSLLPKELENFQGFAKILWGDLYGDEYLQSAGASKEEIFKFKKKVIRRWYQLYTEILGRYFVD